MTTISAQIGDFRYLKPLESLDEGTLKYRQQYIQAQQVALHFLKQGIICRDYMTAKSAMSVVFVTCFSVSVTKLAIYLIVVAIVFE